MSELVQERNDPDAPQSPLGTSAGALLRQARLAAGVHIESIAFALKVPVGKIEALERDDMSVFPDLIFMRALASSVCRGLRMDPAPVLALMPHGARPLLAQKSNQINAKFRDPSYGVRSTTSLGRHSRWLVVAVVFLVLAAAAVAWMPDTWTFSRLSPSVETSVVPAASTVVISPDASSTEAADSHGDAPSVQLDGNRVPPAQAAGALGENNGSAPMANQSALVSSGPSANASPGLQVTVKNDATAKPRITFSARGETWIQVRDQQKKVVVERILKAGESADVDQAGKLYVVVGRANLTDVAVSGKLRDITSSARDNVARFEVGE